ncbi:MAG: hypothetical protein AAFU34_18105 [Pseudomonadota bacterium]
MAWSEIINTPDAENAYVHWWHNVDPNNALRPNQLARKAVRFLLASDRPPQSGAEFHSFDGMDRRDFFDVELPLPERSRNPDWSVGTVWDPRDIVGEMPTDLEDGTPLVGIVDTGISLSHMRFRKSATETRFLASWQQSATWGDLSQPYLPFGEEVYQRTINAALGRHQIDASGAIREEEFYRELKLVEPLAPFGQRDLDFSGAHGTHVLDLASGYDLGEKTGDNGPLPRIIGVNLPSRALHGSAGNFLAFWAAYAVERITVVARAAHLANPGKTFPLYINFSYSMNAGPKNGMHPLESYLKQVIDTSNKTTGKTVMVMPTGNGNLDRTHARIYMGHGKITRSYKQLDLAKEITIPWRLAPADQTSNFVELWAYGVPQTDDARSRAIPPRQPHPSHFTLFVTPPGHTEPLRVPALSSGQHADLGRFARVYCPAQICEPIGKGPQGLLGQRRVNFVICTTPTHIQGTLPDPANGPQEAPAGIWKIKVVYSGTQPINAGFYVQSDQPAFPQSRIGRPSYFDHERYSLYRGDRYTTVDAIQDFRRRDMATYKPTPGRSQGGQNEEPWDLFGPVQRKGTNNALSSWSGVVAIGGYRVSDGRPADYSGSLNFHIRTDTGQHEITGLFPTDDGAAHPGLLAAGARDGSTAAFQGTSMATALACRTLVETGSQSLPTAPTRRPHYNTNLNPLKGGGGQYPLSGLGKRTEVVNARIWED